MEYSKLAEFYQRLEKTTKRLEKTYILSELLSKTADKDLETVMYLLQGRVFPAWDERKIGMSSKLLVRVISKTTGEKPSRVEKLWAKKGGLGLVAEELVANKKHHTLAAFSKSSIEEGPLTQAEVDTSQNLYQTLYKQASWNMGTPAHD